MSRKYMKNTIIILLLILSLVVGIFIGKSNLLNFEKSVEEILLGDSKDYAKDINKYLSKNEVKSQIKIDKIEKVQEGEVSGLNFIQYAVLDDDKDTYVSFVYDMDTQKILSVFTNESHKKDSLNTAKECIKGAIETLKENFLTKEAKEEILNMIESDESGYVIKDGITFYQYFLTDDLEEGYDYDVTYEIDFFEYNGEDINIENTEGEKNE